MVSKDSLRQVNALADACFQIPLVAEVLATSPSESLAALAELEGAQILVGGRALQP